MIFKTCRGVLTFITHFASRLLFVGVAVAGLPTVVIEWLQSGFCALAMVRPPNVVLVTSTNVLTFISCFVEVCCHADFLSHFLGFRSVVVRLGVAGAFASRAFLSSSDRLTSLPLVLEDTLRLRTIENPFDSDVLETRSEEILAWGLFVVTTVFLP